MTRWIRNCVFKDADTSFPSHDAQIVWWSHGLENLVNLETNFRYDASGFAESEISMAALKRFSASSLLLWGMVVIAAAYFFYLKVSDWFEKELDPRSQEFLSGVAAEINRSGTVMIDQETELMPAVGAPGMLIYNYRLVNYSAAQLDRNKFTGGAREPLTQGACNRPETRDNFLKKGVTLRYSYFDKDKQPIGTVDVTPADCGF